jgi:hypothetical protein
MEPWSVCRPVAAESHRFDEKEDPDPGPDLQQNEKSDPDPPRQIVQRDLCITLKA